MYKNRIEGQTIRIDGMTLTETILEDCTLVFAGEARFVLADCELINTKFRLVGPAALIVETFRQLNLLDIKEGLLIDKGAWKPISNYFDARIDWFTSLPLEGKGLENLIGGKRKKDRRQSKEGRW